MEYLNNFSTREKNLWSELLVDVVVGLYYFPRLITLVMAGNGALTGRAMAGLVTSTILVAIIVAVIVSIFLHTQKKPEQVDERDRLFSARGSSIGYTVLVICVLFIMGQIIIIELMPTFAQARLPYELTGVVVAHLLLMALYLSSLVKTLIQLYSYRRGY